MGVKLDKKEKSHGTKSDWPLLIRFVSLIDKVLSISRGGRPKVEISLEVYSLFPVYMYTLYLIAIYYFSNKYLLYPLSFD